MTDPDTESQALALSLSDLPWLAKRVADGQQFNAYQDALDPNEWCVGLGPITDFAVIVCCVRWHIANLLIDALRHAAGQPKCHSRAFEDFDDE
jgi:hypothetical protein